MALIVDPQSNLKHYSCKICKKGFGCGRALGGHMRAHGIGDEINGQVEESSEEYQDASDWESDKERGQARIGSNSHHPPSNNKCMYSLRTNPNRLKTCRACNNCGKEFFSWKSFLKHGKCIENGGLLEDGDYSPPESDGEDIDTTTPMRSSGWSKRKRTFRAKVPSSEEEDLANCLMLLSNAPHHQEESCASARKDMEDRLILTTPLKYYHNNPITTTTLHHPDKSKGVSNKGLFQCKACKKVFNSHQALGGHRASHKKVKGCFAARLDNALDDTLEDDDHEEANNIVHEDELFLPTSNGSLSDHSNSKKKAKVHECSICHRVFSTGQALGGHKRCHWITSNANNIITDPSTSSSSLAMASNNKLYHLQDHLEQIQLRRNFTNAENVVSNSNPVLEPTLDLNVPAALDDQAKAHEPGLMPKPSNCMEVSTEILLQAWMGVDGKDKRANCHQNQEGHNNNLNNPNSPIIHNVEDEEDHRKVKLAKLSELKDLNVNESSSPWLQVGLGSTTGP